MQFIFNKVSKTKATGVKDKKKFRTYLYIIAIFIKFSSTS